MQKIVPHLWFDQEAVSAAEFYCSIFPESKINNIGQLEDTPSGKVDLVSLELWGYAFEFISAGPIFKINASVSFTVLCETEAEVDKLWAGMSEGGQALMPLQSYPFSKKYGWVMDKFGVSWQIMLIEQKAPTQRIVPAIMFTQDLCGNADRAIDHYVSVFKDAERGMTMRYGENETPDTNGDTQYAEYTLAGQKFSAMDSPHEHKFKLNEAISFIVYCDNQTEIDHYWSKLSAVPEAEQCGWLKDKFGVSWQIVPTLMKELMASGDKEKLARVTAAFLQMKKFDIERLGAAANNIS